MAIPDRTTGTDYHYHVYDYVGSRPWISAAHHNRDGLRDWLDSMKNDATMPKGGFKDKEYKHYSGRRATGPQVVRPTNYVTGGHGERCSLMRDMLDLRDVADDCNLNPTINEIARTACGRSVICLAFGSTDPNAPQVLLTGGVHAREWISVEIPYLIAEYLIKNYKPGLAVPANLVLASIKNVLERCRVFVIPMLNPDGHCWSVATTEKRWRKNRNRWFIRAQNNTLQYRDNTGVWQNHPAAPRFRAAGGKLKRGVGPGRTVSGTHQLDTETGVASRKRFYASRVFFGVDCNRNCWGGGAAPVGKSLDPCAETYRGPTAFSESESTALNNFNLPRLAASIDYHSAMGRVLYHEDAVNAAGSLDAGERNAITHVATCMRNHIAQYQQDAGAGDCTGPYPDATTIHAASAGNDSSVGSIMDLCYRNIISNNRIPLAYTIELDPVKTGAAAYNPACNAADRWFQISRQQIQTVFEKNLTAALCLMWHATSNPREPNAVTRGNLGTTIANSGCPFRPVGGGGGGNGMVAKIVNRGNQPPNP